MPYLVSAAARRRSDAAHLLLLWLDAANLADEGAIESWGVATAPSRNNRPTFSRTGLNGRPAVVFDGENDCLSLPQINAGSTWRAFAVLRRDGGQTYGTAFSLLSANNTQSAGLAINNDATKGPIQVSGASHHKGGIYATGVPRILTVGPGSIKQNNVAAGVSSISAPFTVSGALSMVGAANSTAPTRFFCGAISELRVYSSLTDSQETAIYRELAEKWGLA